jgi:hypothetical protein
LALDSVLDLDSVLGSVLILVFGFGFVVVRFLFSIVLVLDMLCFLFCFRIGFGFGFSCGFSFGFGFCFDCTSVIDTIYLLESLACFFWLNYSFYCDRSFTCLFMSVTIHYLEHEFIKPIY